MKILLVVALLLVLFAIVVSLQPAAYRIVRSATMSALAPVVFAQVNDFSRWEAWSPWAKLDPAVKNTLSSPPAGQGATFAWSGNNKVGAGRMTITESQPAERVVMSLEFIRPFKAVCTTEFTFKPDGGGTVVTWTMSGKNNFIGKAFCLFMNQDRMIGGDFEKGLAQLKAVTESAAR